MHLFQGGKMWKVDWAPGNAGGGGFGPAPGVHPGALRHLHDASLGQGSAEAPLGQNREQHESWLRSSTWREENEKLPPSTPLRPGQLPSGLQRSSFPGAGHQGNLLALTAPGCWVLGAGWIFAWVQSQGRERSRAKGWGHGEGSQQGWHWRPCWRWGVGG